ncbi:hypothetical protein GCM10022243_43860 [Saccharothrix violaceirubra]
MTGSVSYENIDIQLRVPLSLAADDLVDKIVTRRRGGFRYEKHALFFLLLRALGFDVTAVRGAIERESRGDSAWRNPMPLLVALDGARWIVDGGLGDGFVEPVPLRTGAHARSRQHYRVERLGDDLWRPHHHPGGSTPPGDVRFGDHAPGPRPPWT